MVCYPFLGCNNNKHWCVKVWHTLSCGNRLESSQQHFKLWHFCYIGLTHMFPHQPSGKRLFVGTLFGSYIYIDGAGINRRTTRCRFYLLKSESPREHQHFKTKVLEEKRATVVAVFMVGLGPTLLTAAVWRDDRHGLFPCACPWRPGLPVQPQLCST